MSSSLIFSWPLMAAARICANCSSVSSLPTPAAPPAPLPPCPLFTAMKGHITTPMLMLPLFLWPHMRQLEHTGTCVPWMITRCACFLAPRGPAGLPSSTKPILLSEVYMLKMRSTSRSRSAAERKRPV